ncbi:1,4-alpha-glucan branching enzyme [Enhygromyxa salina]|uniref:1,4-alpha-glucan branching enzyme n=1 Tax=Enhygromyxa salina TaxID=215803 RepID=A0A0C2DH40_9BACT|nr:hemerythrin domain-containing protein [Enhygromyxa salina]KIG18997.1 1,4-alpha-glucan branching enzyme [Enhygromyxa salina]
MSSAKTTTNHTTIKQWVEQRGGHPAHVKRTGDGDDDPGILRVDFPGYSGGKTLEKISWTEFFEKFESSELAFLYQDEPDSRFSKLISRANMDEEDQDEDQKEDELEDALALLESQHREVEALFERIGKSGSARQKSKLFAELADQLAAHAKIEETIFYPAVCDDDTSALLHEAVEDHLKAKRVLAELLEIDALAAKFTAKLAKLEQMVREHVKEEETQLFAQVRELEGVDLNALGKRMRRRFKQLIADEPRTKVPSETDAAAELPC